MPSLQIHITLNSTLHRELIDAAREAECTIGAFAAQAVEACLAGRRLESITPNPRGKVARTFVYSDTESLI